MRKRRSFEKIITLTLVLSFWFGTQSLFAQYFGGDGSGQAKIRYASPYTCPLFYGGNADGHARGLRPNPDPCLPFKGNEGDGYAKSLRPNPAPCSFFMGGAGDGYARNFAPTNCVMFLGGNGDGYARGKAPTICVMYAGGLGDGYATGSKPDPTCPMYYGGIADGHASFYAQPLGNTLVWLGKNTNWFDTQNWSLCKLPTCGYNVLIPVTANNPVISAAGAACKTITINTGAALQINSTYRLDVCGHFYNNGALTTQTNSTVRFIGDSTQVVQGNFVLANAFTNLTVDKPADSVKLASTLEVRSTLNLTKGIVVTQANEVSVLNRSTTSIINYSTASYIQGNLRRYLNATGNYVFPVGEYTKGYQLAEINFTSATSIDNLRAFFQPYVAVPVVSLPASECSLSGGYSGEMLDNGSWTIDAFPPAAANTGIYTAKLHNRNFSNGGNFAFTVAKRPSGGAGAWALNGSCVTSSSDLLTTRTGMQGFSDFGAAKGEKPFPVELLKLSATALEDAIRLDWVTGFEISNKGFFVERSENGVDFQTLGWQDGQGNTTRPTAYSQTDFDVKPMTVYYYRLKQVEFNGQFTYSNLVEAMVSANGRLDVRVYPNPTKASLYVELNAENDQKVQFRLTDAFGKIVFERTEMADQQLFSLDLSDVSAGVYFLQIRNAMGMQTVKVVKN